jgi:hypothetical protein
MISPGLGGVLADFRLSSLTDPLHVALIFRKARYGTAGLSTSAIPQHSSSRRRDGGTQRRSGEPEQVVGPSPAVSSAILGKRRESSRLANQVEVAKRSGTTQPVRSQGRVGRGGRERRPEAGWSEKPTRTATGPRSDEGTIKLGGQGRVCRPGAYLPLNSQAG